MIASTANARISTVYDEHFPPYWLVSHPALHRSLHVDPAHPDNISRADAASYARGWEIAGGDLWRGLVAALVEQRGVEERHAERIVDAWEMWSWGKQPGFIVEAVAHA